VLYKYLADMTNTKIPFAQNKSFVDKYGLANRDQTLTEIFDYIRSTNLVDTEAGSHGPITIADQNRSDGLGKTGTSFDTYPLGYTRFFGKTQKDPIQTLVPGK